MLIKMELRINDNFRFLEIINVGNKTELRWYSTFDKEVYRTTDKNRIKEIYIKLNDFAFLSTIYSNRSLQVTKLLELN